MMKMMDEKDEELGGIEGANPTLSSHFCLKRSHSELGERET